MLLLGHPEARVLLAVSRAGLPSTTHRASAAQVKEVAERTASGRTLEYPGVFTEGLPADPVYYAVWPRRRPASGPRHERRYSPSARGVLQITIRRSFEPCRAI
jgi:hypothetical protein